MRIKRKLRRDEKALMDKYNNNFMAHSSLHSNKFILNKCFYS